MSVVTVSRKEQIYSIARNLFKERGYAATSMRDLAKDVGIEPASLYNHISSKEEILQNICFEMATAFFDEIQPVLKTSISPEGKLKMAIEGHISVIARHLDASSVFFKDWIFLSEVPLRKFKDLRRKYERIFIEILKEGAAEKVFKKMDTKVAVFTIFSALNATYDLYNPKNKISPLEIAGQISTILLDGLKYRASKPVALKHIS